MGLLDRFRSTPSTTPVGESGRNHRQGIIVPEDHVPELTGARGAKEFDRMWRSDGDARKAAQMVINPIAAASYAVHPYGGDEATDKDREVAKFIEWALFDVLRLTSHLASALRVCFRNGRAPHEKVWELRHKDGRDYWVVRKLDVRLPRSIWKYNQNAQGDLESIEQMLSAKGRVTIPADDLVYYRLGAEGDNWEGESLLRAAYKHFIYKEKLELIDAMGHERYALGVPVAYPPTNATDQQMADLETILGNIRSHDSSFIVSPWPHAQFAEKGQGAFFDILTQEGTHTTSDSLKYHSDRIAASVLEEFMRLGQGGEGARATADVQQDPFLLFCEVLAGAVVEDTLNRDLIPHLVRLNFEGVEGMPTLKASLIDSTSVQQLSEAVKKLSDAGALHADDVLEDHIRDRLDLPPADVDAREARKASEVATAEAAAAVQKAALEGDAAPAPGEKEPEKAELDAPVMLRRQDRPMTAWEGLMELDAVEGAINDARDRFVSSSATITHRLAAELAASPDSDPDTTDLVDAVHAELEALYNTGRHTVRQELAAQRPSSMWTALAAGDEPPPELRLRAVLTADGVAAAMRLAIRGVILTRGKQAQAALQLAAEGAARKALRSSAVQHAATALGLGRFAEGLAQEKHIRGARYTSLLDGGSCPECRLADDDVLRPMNDPVRLQRIPPNPNCLGGGGCRCLEFFELDDEAAPDR